MNVKQAKEVARQWVTEEGPKVPGFRGAFLAGSTNWLPDDAVVPATSDVDITVVLDDPNRRDRLGVLAYRDVILDITCRPSAELQSPEAILGDYQMAGHFRTPNIILDSMGQLTELQAAVSNDYAKREWVYRRCEHAKAKVLGLAPPWYRLNESDPFHEQVVHWLFPTGITTHVLLVAGLKSPTVRRRYLAARELLSDYGHLDFYEPLLEMLGCSQMSAARAEHHLAALTDAFDVAKRVVKTPYRFASYVSDAARPIAIDGSRELIERGDHREAIFWMVAAYSRCQTILYRDASLQTQEKFSHGYRQLLSDIGITSFADLRQRSEQVKRLLPRVWEVAEAIIAANQGIED